MIITLTRSFWKALVWRVYLKIIKNGFFSTLNIFYNTDCSALACFSQQQERLPLVLVMADLTGNGDNRCLYTGDLSPGAAAALLTGIPELLSWLGVPQREAVPASRSLAGPASESCASLNKPGCY